VVSIDLAIRLRRAGLRWRPVAGDRFMIPDRDMDDDVFVVSDMTIQVHDLTEGPVIGFNGTVEWALDDVEKDEVVWLPREDQLRHLLGGAFRRLEPDGDGFRVVVEVLGAAAQFTAGDAEDAYGLALLHVLDNGTVRAG
jgi:hypothetical protein